MAAYQIAPELNRLKSVKLDYKLSTTVLKFFSKPTSRIALIFDPPRPIIEPHWLAGTINFIDTGTLVEAEVETFAFMSCEEKKYEQIS